MTHHNRLHDQSALKSVGSSKEEPSSKNMTYERALSAFFEDQEPTEEQRQNLPTDVDGLSARRQALIEEIFACDDSVRQLNLVKALRLRFGLTSDIRIICLALTTEDEPLAIEGLHCLIRWLKARDVTSSESMRKGLIAWRDQLSRKVETLLLRSFNQKIQSLAKHCEQLLS